MYQLFIQEIIIYLFLHLLDMENNGASLVAKCCGNRLPCSLYFM